MTENILDKELMLLLSNFEGISHNNYKKIVNLYKNLQDFWYALKNHDNELYQYIKSEHENDAAFKLGEFSLFQLNSQLDKNGIGYTIENDSILYYKGDFSLYKECRQKSLSIFSSRNCSSTASESVQLLCTELNKNNLVAVCGMAQGIDDVIVKNSDRYIGVVAGGIMGYCPKFKSGGLIISEYGLYMPPIKYMYERRNIRMCDISEACLLVEARDGSGAIQTLNNVKGKKKVFCFPSSVINERATGSNRFIFENPESMVISIFDIIEYLGGNVQCQMQRSVSSITPIEQSIIDCIICGSNHYDEILSVCNIEKEQLNEMLMIMEIEGKIKKVAGNKYIVE